MPKYIVRSPEGQEFEVTAPDGATQAEVLAYAQQNFAQMAAEQPKPAPVPTPTAPQQPSGPEQNTFQRLTGLAAQGFADSALEAIGAIPDTVAGGFRSLGIPAPENPNFYKDQLKSGYQWLGDTLATPFKAAGLEGESLGGQRSGWEDFAYGAGGGAADAATVMLPAAAVANTARAGSVTQNVARSLASQPVLQTIAGAAGGGVSEATDSPALGLVTALAVPALAAGARRAITPIANHLTPEQRRLAQIAQAEGIPLTVGQQTGSRNLQTAESVLGELPFSGGMAARGQEAQRRAFNRAVLERAGINAEYATPDMLNTARTHFGREFEQISARNTLRFDNRFARDLGNVIQRYQRKLPSQQREVFQNYIDDITAAPVMPGATYQVTRSDLSKQAKAARKADPYFADALRGLRDALDDAMERNVVGTVDEGAWRDLRTRYGAFKNIAKAMDSTVTDAAKGNIPPTQLVQAVREGGQYQYGTGNLNDLARVGQAFVREQIPNSGTSSRQMWRNILTASGGSSATTAAVLGAPWTAGLIAGGMALPPAVQSFLRSRAGQAYLTNQMLQGRGPQMNRALVSALAAQEGAKRLSAPTPQQKR